MAEISRGSLFGALNALCFRSLESAYGFCRLRENPHVEVVHWLHQILQLQESDLTRIIDHYGVERSRVQKEFEKALDSLPRGSTSVVDFSPHLEEAAERAFVFGSLLFGEDAVRSGHLLFGVLKTPGLRNALAAAAPSLAAIRTEDLSDRFASLVAGSPEDGAPRRGSSAAPARRAASSPGADPGSPASSGALAEFTSDLTAEATAGRIDPIVGRDEEIRQVIDVLLRRRQNNPILVGEAGVGKTAVVEGFARRLAEGDAPPALRSQRLLSLDVGALSAGASMKGEFEKRLKQVIEEVRASPARIILFIDEAHTLIGAGGQAGTGDAANLLKPALARGELRTIAATTWAEYKKHIEKDPALTRRFQPVKVDEPDDARAVAMMRAISGVMEAHHKVRVLDEALAASVSLSRRYIPDRQLPDKSVTLLDTACARVALSQHATPARVEAAQRRIDSLGRELDIIDREEREGADRSDRRAAVEAARTEAEAELAALNARWTKEKDAVARVLSLRRALSGEAAPMGEGADEGAGEGGDDPKPEGPAGDRDALLADLRAALADLAEAQGDDALVLPAVDESAVARVVADWTGVPVGRMVRDEMASVLAVGDRLKERVVGQDDAVEAIAMRVKTARAGLADPSKPIGVFLLCGPSGVGKTETALSLAETLYGGEQNMITLAMSEFQESHTVSTLKGAPPGYVGYGEGGRLTEAVRRRPYSVVLLDEVEKAHPDVHEVFFQVFDKGAMEDGEGRLIDFKNTLILLTSNVGDRVLSDLAERPGGPPTVEEAREALRAPLLEVFPAALLGRMLVLPYYPLTDAVLETLVRHRLERIGRRLADAHGARFHFTDAAVAAVASRCRERESGGRAIDAILTNTVLPRLSERLLEKAMAGESVTQASLDAPDGDFVYKIG